MAYDYNRLKRIKARNTAEQHIIYDSDENDNSSYDYSRLEKIKARNAAENVNATSKPKTTATSAPKATATGAQTATAGTKKAAAVTYAESKSNPNNKNVSYNMMTESEFKRRKQAGGGKYTTNSGRTYTDYNDYVKEGKVRERERELEEVMEEQNKNGKTALADKFFNAIGAAGGRQSPEDHTSIKKRNAYKAKYNLTEDQVNQDLVDYRETKRTQKYDRYKGEKDFAAKSGKTDGNDVLSSLDAYEKSKTMSAKEIRNADNKTKMLMAQGETLSRTYGYTSALTEDERKMYRYIYNTQGDKAAIKYLDDLEYAAGKRLVEQEKTQLGKEGGGKLAARSAQTVVTNLIGGPIAAVSDVYHTIKGEDINPYDQAHALQNYTQNVRNATSERIEENTDAEIAGRNVWSFLYQTGMSAADSAVGAATMGTAYTFVMGSSAASQRAAELYEQGASREQVIAGSLAAGAAEMFFEKFSIENLINTSSAKSLTDVALNILKQAGIEASEEAATEIANKITDSAIRGETSDRSQKIRTYMDNGMSEDEARKAVIKEDVGDIFESAIGGAISGGMLGGLATGQRTATDYRSGKAINEYGNGRALIDEVRQFNSNAQNAGETGGISGDLATDYENYINKKNGRADTIGGNIRAGNLQRVALQEAAQAYQNARNAKTPYSQIKSDISDIMPGYDRRDVNRMSRAAEKLINGRNIGINEMTRAGNVIASNNDVDNYVAEQIGRREIADELGKSYRNIAQASRKSFAPEKTYIFSDDKTREAMTVDDETGKAVPLKEYTPTDETKRTLINRAKNMPAEIADIYVNAYKGEDIDDYDRAFQRVKTWGRLGGHEDLLTYEGFNASDYFTDEQKKQILKYGLESKEIKTGLTNYSTNQKLLNQHGKTMLALIDRIAKDTDFEVVLFDQLSDKDGKSAYNGAFTKQANRIALSLDSDKGLLLRTLAHEQGHFIKLHNEQGFNKLADLVQQAYEGRDDERAKLFEKYKGQNYADKNQLEELVCDSLFDVYDEDFIRNLVNEDKGLAKQLKSKLDNFISAMNLNMKSMELSGNHDEMVAIRADEKRLKDVQRIFNEELAKASANFRASVGAESKPQIDSRLDSILDESEPETERNVKRVTLENGEEVIEEDLPFSTKDVKGKEDKKYFDAIEKYGEDSEEVRSAVEKAAKEAGYTRKGYHGTNAEFTKFSRELFGKNYGKWSELGGGFYFTPSEEMAKHWGDVAVSKKGGTAKTLSVFLKAQNMLDTDKPITDEQARKILDQYPNLDEDSKNWYLERPSRFIEYLQYHDYTPQQIADLFAKMGYDGIADGTQQFIVFNPEQIKSADTVTYDDNGNIIPLSERFNSEKNDIRWSTKDRAAKDIFGNQADKEDNAVYATDTDTDSAGYEGDVDYSLKDAEKIGEASVKYNGTHGAVPEDVFNKGVDTMVEMADIMRGFTDKLPEDINGTTIFKNGSYGKTVENTTLCVRTLVYEAFKDEVAKKIGRPLTVAESLLVSQKIYDIAKDPQCLYCYVAADRKAYDEYIGNYVDTMTKYVTRLADGENAEKLYDEYCDERGLNGKQRQSKLQKKRWALWTAAAKSGDYITAKDVATQDDRDKIINDKGKLADMVKDAQRYAQNASWAKKKMTYRAYKGDILRMSKKWVDTLNSEYGMRMYSFSDFTPAFITENMQQIIDIAARGLKSLAYTKDTDYAKIFAGTGQAINISCYAKYDKASGTYVADERQGASWREAQELRDKHNNVGVVMVAMNDNMIDWALNQDWVDVVIPYHIVKTGTKIANAYEWNNYTADSSDRANGKNETIYPTEHNNDFETFQKLIEERGLKPRFEKWYNRAINGEISGDTYMKLVNEVRLPASELSAIQPVFDLEAAKESFNKFIEKGGYEGGWYLPDVDVDQEVNTVADDIQSGKTNRDVEYGKQFAEILEKTNLSTKDAPTEMDAYYDDVIRENDALQMIFANIEDTVDMQRKAETLDRKEIDRLVKRVLKENHSSDENFGKAVHTAFDYMAQAGNNIDSDAVTQYLMQATSKMLQKSEYLDDEAYRETKWVRDKLRTDGLYVPEEDMKSVASEFGYSSPAQMRRHLFGKIRIVNDERTTGYWSKARFKTQPEFEKKGYATVGGVKYTDYIEYQQAVVRYNMDSKNRAGRPMSIDDFYAQMQSDPGLKPYFDFENFEDDPYRGLVEFLDATKPRYYEPFGEDLSWSESSGPTWARKKSKLQGVYNMYLEEAAADKTAELLKEYYNITRVQTDQQKMLQYKYDIDRRYRQFKQDLRNDYNKKLKRAKMDLIEANREYVNDYRDRRENTDRRRVLNNNIDRNWKFLNTRLEDRSKSKHIPDGLEGLAYAMVKALPGGDSGAKRVRFNRGDLNALEAEYKNTIDRMFPEGKDDNIGSGVRADLYDLNSQFVELIDRIAPSKKNDDDYKTAPAAIRSALSTEDLGILSNVTANIRHLVDTANKLFGEEKQATVDEVAERVMHEMKRGQQSRFQRGSRNKQTERLKGLDEFRGSLTKPEYLFKNSGSEELYDLYKDVRRGENTEAEILRNAKEFLQKAKAKHNYDPTWATKTVSITTDTGVKLNMTQEDAMYIFALARRKQGMKHLVGDLEKNQIGGGVSINDAETGKLVASRLTPNDLGKIGAKLSNDQVAYTKEVMDYLSKTVGEERNKVSMALMGFKKYVEGNYLPIVVADNTLQEDVNRQKGSKTIANQNASKTLNKAAKNAIQVSGFDDIVLKHIYDSALYCGYAVPTENLNKVWNAKTTDGTLIHGLIEWRNGVNSTKQMHQLIKDLNEGQMSESQTKIAKSFFTKAKKAATMANISVIVQQPTAVFRAMRYIEPKYFATVATKADLDEMYENNGCAVKKSIGYYDVNVGKTAIDWMAEYKPGANVRSQWTSQERRQQFNLKDKVETIASYGAEKADEITWGAIWNAAKNKVKVEQHLSGDEMLKAAAEIFQDTILKTQVYDSVFSKSALLRSQNGWDQLVGAFMSEPLTNLNMLSDAVYNRKKTGNGPVIQSFAAVTASLVVNAACKAIVQSFRQKDDKDEKDFLVKYLAHIPANVLDDVFGMIPYINTIIDGIQGYKAVRMDTQFIGTMTQAYTYVKKAIGNENAGYEEYKKAIMQMTNAIAQMTGIPAYNAVRDVWTASEKLYDRIVNNEANVPFSVDDLALATAEEIGLDTSIDYSKYVDKYLSGKESYKKTMERIGDDDGKRKQVTTAIGKKYRAGTISKSDAKHALIMLSGKTPSEADTYIKTQDTRMKKEREASDTDKIHP